jgi:chromosome segregation ATPase
MTKSRVTKSELMAEIDILKNDIKESDNKLQDARSETNRYRELLKDAESETKRVNEILKLETSRREATEKRLDATIQSLSSVSQFGYVLAAKIRAN